MATDTVPSRLVDPRMFALWGQAIGSAGRVATDGNAPGLSRSTGGFVLGADARFDADLRLGVAGGYRYTSFNTAGSTETGTIDGVFGGLYGDYRAGPVSLRFGALAADEAVTMRRLVTFQGFTEAPSARTGGATVQGFGEVGYRSAVAFSRGVTAMIEPFVGGAAVAIRRDRFTEQGGAAALAGAGQVDTILVSNVGLRGQAVLELDSGLQILTHGLVGYRHAYGEMTPVTHLTVVGTGAAFASAGLPIDRSALVAQAGLSTQVASNATLGVSYLGQIGPLAQDHAAKIDFNMRF